MVLSRDEIRSEALYSVGPVSKTLGVGPDYVRALIDAGTLDARQAGTRGHFKITGASLLAYIDGPKAAGHE